MYTLAKPWLPPSLTIVLVLRKNDSSVHGDWLTTDQERSPLHGNTHLNATRSRQLGFPRQRPWPQSDQAENYRIFCAGRPNSNFAIGFILSRPRLISLETSDHVTEVKMDDSLEALLGTCCFSSLLGRRWTIVQ